MEPVVKPKVTADQPTNAPTRKMWAVIVSAVVATLIEVLVANYLPTLAEQLPSDLRVTIYGMVIGFAGYYTREWKSA